MRKIIRPHLEQGSPLATESWLDLEALTQVEVTSEDAEHPIESALSARAAGWRAQNPGEQSIRLLFDKPQRLKCIRLLFREEKQTRTQEFVLRWTTVGAGPPREIVRQQFHFCPAGATAETEEYQVQLENVVTLELVIIPNLGGGTYASVAELRVA